MVPFMRAAILLLMLAAGSGVVHASDGVDSSFTYLFDVKKSSDSTLEKVLGTFSYCRNLVEDGYTDIKVTLELHSQSFSDPVNPTENLIGIAFQVNLAGAPLSGLAFTDVKTDVFCKDCTLSTYRSGQPVICLKGQTNCKTAAGVGPWFPLTPTTAGYYDVEMKLTMPNDGKVQKITFTMTYPGKDLDASTLAGTNWYFRFQQTDGGQSSKMGGTLPPTLPGCIKVKSIAGNCYGQSYDWTVDKTLTSSSPMPSNTTAAFTITATKFSSTTTHLTLGGLLSIKNNAGSDQTIQNVNVKLVKFCDASATGSTEYDVATVAGAPLPSGGVVNLQYDAAVEFAQVNLQCDAPAIGRKLLAKRPKKKKKKSSATPSIAGIQLNSVVSYPNYQVVVDVNVLDPVSGSSRTVRDVSVAFTLPDPPTTWFNSTTLKDALTLPDKLTCGGLSIDGVAQASCPNPTLFTEADVSDTTTRNVALTLLNADAVELTAINLAELEFADVPPVTITLPSLDTPATTLSNSIDCVDTPKPSESTTVAVSPVPSGGDPPPPLPPINCSECCTYTQGGWGAKPAGKNPGTKLDNWYTSQKPNPAMVIGGAYTITCSTNVNIREMLQATPRNSSDGSSGGNFSGGAGAKPGVLTASYVNATTELYGTDAPGIYAQQVTALWLNVNVGSTASPAWSIQGLYYCAPGELKGKTVGEILVYAQHMLGGGEGTTYKGLTVTDWNDLVDGLNNAFDNCKKSTSADSPVKYLSKTACP